MRIIFGVSTVTIEAVDVNSHSGIYDLNGNCEQRDLFDARIISFLVRNGLKLKQAEWNIVKIGNSAHAGKCIKARYKNIRMETIDDNSPRTISIMSNGVIDVSFSIFVQIIVVGDCFTTMSHVT